MEKVPRRMYVEQQKVRKKESGSSKIVLQNGKEYGMKKKTKGMNEVTRYMKIKTEFVYFVPSASRNDVHDIVLSEYNDRCPLHVMHA